MTHRDARFVRMAMEEAKKSSVCMQHGCIAVMHGKVIARSFNTACRASPTVWWSCHAEMGAIKKINEHQQQTQKRCQRITLYIVRTTPHGELHASAPCMHCTRAIQLCPCIKRIIYSESDGSNPLLLNYASLMPLCPRPNVDSLAGVRGCNPRLYVDVLALGGHGVQAPQQKPVQLCVFYGVQIRDVICVVRYAIHVQ